MGDAVRMLAVASALACASACGRSGFDALEDGGTDAPAPDAAGPPPWSGDFTLEDPELVPELASDGLEAECFFVTDTTLWFQSDRAGGSGSTDVYQATRAAVGAPWGDIIELSGVNTPNYDGRLLVPTADSLVGYYYSDRAGTLGGTDMWSVTRDSADEPFDDTGLVNLGALNTVMGEYDPWISPDDMRLYYVVIDPPGGLGGQDLVVAERPAPGEPFGPVAVIPGLSSASSDDNLYLSPDELFIIFASDRTPGGVGGKDLWYARRPDLETPFSGPQLVPVVNSASNDWEACFSRHGELYFASDRPGGQGQDMYMTHFVPL